MTATPVTNDLVRLRRMPDRGTTDRAVIDAILDEGRVCHLGYVREARPVVVPTLYARDGDDLVLHGSAASRAMRTAGAGLPVCVTVTLLDGLVLARAALHHSANYRSVVVHGEAQLLVGEGDKQAALQVLTDHVAPGRWELVRPPTPAELRATAVLRLPLTHAIAKVRSHGVVDDESDLALPVWAGVVPVRTILGDPEADPGLADATLAPPSWAPTGAVA